MKAIRDLLHFNRHVRRPLRRALLLMAMVGLMLMGVTCAALSADLEVVRKQSGLQSFPVVDNDIIYKGALVCVDTDGWLAPGADAAGYKFAGVAYEKVDNTLSGHSAGGKSCRVYTEGVFKLVCTSITQAMVGDMMFLTDDTLVDETTGGTYYIPVGRLVEYVSATSGWVDIGQRHLVGGDGVILAPEATNMFAINTWGVVQASGSLYMAADYGAYINSWKAGGLEVCASSDVRLHVGGKGWNVGANGVCSTAYTIRCTGIIDFGVGNSGTLKLPYRTSPVTQPTEGTFWYNSTLEKLQFATGSATMETVTSA